MIAQHFIAIAALLWALGGALALVGRPLMLIRALLVLGTGIAILAAIIALPGGTPPTSLPFLRFANEAAEFSLSSSALWLMGFGLMPALLALLVSTPSRDRQAPWLFGAAISLLGALGIFGLQNGAFFLIAWELMSLGGAMMILGERLGELPGSPVLFMLGLLEVGAVALLVAVLIFALPAGAFGFGAYAGNATLLPAVLQSLLGILLVIGFGAKLGLLPFYEWFPAAYGAGSGATGALLSGVILNAAFFGLARSMLHWLPAAHSGINQGFGIGLCIIGTLSAILTTLYAFQQEDWRCLLSFSSAENASIAVIALGACLLFRAGHLPLLAGLAFTVALLHLAGHSLAKGAMFLAADGVYAATGSYRIEQKGLLRGNWIGFGAGALFAAMSLAAMPPQAGFVSEWFMFQTVFQGFHLDNLAGRLTLVLTGAGLALTAAIAFATFVKLFGVGLAGDSPQRPPGIPAPSAAAVAILGALVLVLAVGMPIWLRGLSHANVDLFGADAAARMSMGWILVPLTRTFAFISPSKLIIAMPLLALFPAGLVLLGRRYKVRRAPVWYGGSPQDAVRSATTALTFSNALRTFYSFVYRPREEIKRESSGSAYYVTRLQFDEEVAPVFGPYLFRPAIRSVLAISARLRRLQSGHLNFYLALIGILLVIILAISLI